MVQMSYPRRVSQALDISGGLDFTSPNIPPQLQGLRPTHGHNS